MNIPKALEILSESLQTHDSTRAPDFKDAIQLGIEALKVTAGIRKGEHMFPPLLLPGETES